jgi:hypothetical protein
MSLNNMGKKTPDFDACLPAAAAAVTCEEPETSP